MADLAPTAANVKGNSTTSVQNGTSGEAITSGDSVYRDSSDSNKVKKADHTTAAKATAVGIALNTVEGTDKPISWASQGNVAGMGATQGAAYYVSANAGKVAPEADLLTGDFVTALGIGKSDGSIDVVINVSGVAKP